MALILDRARLSFRSYTWKGFVNRANSYLSRYPYLVKHRHAKIRALRKQACSEPGPEFRCVDHRKAESVSKMRSHYPPTTKAGPISSIRYMAPPRDTVSEGRRVRQKHLPVLP